MAATTVDRVFFEKAYPVPFKDQAPVAASQKLLVGTVALIDANGRLIEPTGTGETALRAVFIKDQADNSSGADDAINADYVSGIVVDMVGSGLAQSDLGSACYVADNQTISTDDGTSNYAYLGRIVRVESATRAYVYIPGVLED